MPSPVLEQLLILQDRDQRVHQVKGQLEEWPRERARTEADIQSEKDAVTAVVEKLKRLEVKRAELEGQVADHEARMVKYKTQQLEVKKQEEYTALEHEVATLREQIDLWETEELDVLDAIDHAEQELVAIRAQSAARIHTLETHLQTIDQALADNRAQVGEAESRLASAREGVESAEALQLYDFVSRQVKRFPYLVAMSGGKCGGCHLKVSNDVEGTARRGTELVRCSSCGRIVYFD